MMPATAASTSAAVSRFIARSAAKPASKSGAAVESLTGIDDLAQAIDPGAHLIGARLQRRPVDDEAGGDIRDALDLDRKSVVEGKRLRLGGGEVGRDAQSVFVV